MSVLFPSPSKRCVTGLPSILDGECMCKCPMWGWQRGFKAPVTSADCNGSLAHWMPSPKVAGRKEGRGQLSAVDDNILDSQRMLSFTFSPHLFSLPSLIQRPLVFKAVSLICYREHGRDKLLHPKHFSWHLINTSKCIILLQSLSRGATQVSVDNISFTLSSQLSLLIFY